MALNINTNIGSLNAQRHLMNNSSSLNRTLERLSSGQRINNASDDAAGLAISEGFISQTRGLNQAVRNANDGLSLMGTAEAALNEQTSILQRVRELAVQAANDTNSSSNRTALNNEVTQLKQEFDRIAKTVQFNGSNLLDGTFTGKELQVGAYSGADQRIAVSMSSSRASDVGKLYKATGSAATHANAMAADDDVTITVGGSTISLGVPTDDGVSTNQGTSSAAAYKSAIDALGKNFFVEASTTYNNGAQDVTQSGGVLDGTNNVVINDVEISGFTLSSDSSTQIAEYINANVDGVTASLDSSDELTLTAADGRNIEIVANGTGAALTGRAAGTHHGKLTITSGQSFSITQDTTDFLGMGGVSVSSSVDTTADVNQLNVTTKDNANKAVMIIDYAIESINSQRATIGAQTNRINSVVNTLSAVAENMSAANSRIRDADFAAETAAMTRNQILQQAAVSVLAQANQGPQIALSLLR